MVYKIDELGIPDPGHDGPKRSDLETVELCDTKEGDSAVGVCRHNNDCSHPT